MAINSKRRQLLQAAVLAAAYPSALLASTKPTLIALSDGSLQILSDGNLSLPVSGLFDDEQRESEAKQLFSKAGLAFDNFALPLNVSLWQTDDRLVLFDVGSGSQFTDSTGLLPSRLEAAGVDPYDVTDVVLTHAHPDHCWGLLDDFNDLLCPDATYHIHGKEYDHWMSQDTLDQTPEAGLAMVAGARNRLPLIEGQLSRFKWGDEILPGIEAVDTHGHTPGHTSFVIHSGSEQVMIVGDALIHQILSFQRPRWPWRTDHDADAAVQTRLTLLDRLAADKTNLVAYHLPVPGHGQVEKDGKEYRYVAS